MYRRLLILVTVLLVTSTLATPALAGGWAVITLDALPGEIHAGQPLSIGFMVRQHGQTPMEGLTPTIRLTNPESGETLVVTAEPEGVVGHYVADINLPVSGSWSWSIEAFTITQPMPDLVVLPAAAPDAQPQSQPATASINTSNSGPMAAGLAGVILAGAALAYALRRRSRWALAVVALGLLISGIGFARAGSTPVSARSKEPVQLDSLYAPVASSEKGEALFVAKGCLACHRNDRVEARYRVFSTEHAPDLTALKTSPEYLRLWLSDPASVRPDTEMPNLKLSESEIEALAAFLLDQPAQ